MTQLLREPDNISNHFDDLFNGIGHRGSSFTNVDGLIHDGKSKRFLMLEFKHWGESVSSGQHWAMKDFAKIPNCSSWIIHWGAEMYKVETLPDSLFWHLNKAGLRQKLKDWWDADNSK